MTNETNPQELTERLKLIEDMLQEGRRSTERWGWVFVLWGAALFVATFWALVANPMLAWTVTIAGASILTFLIAWKMNDGKPRTAKSLAIGSIWNSVGIAIGLFAFCGGISGHSEVHLTLAGIEILLGVANASSAFILRWGMQLAVAITWWAAGVATLFVDVKALFIIYLVTVFLCQIVFGLYLMLHEYTERKRGLSHA